MLQRRSERCDDRPHRVFVLEQFASAISPAWGLLFKEVVKDERVPKADMHRAEGLAQEAHGAQHARQRFRLLRSTAQLAEIAAGLHDFLIAEIDGDEGEWAPAAAQTTAYGHAEHAAPWGQKPPRSTASAFDEVLHGKAIREDAIEVFLEDGRVERVVAKATTHEEGAGATQQRADHRNVQVLAGGNVRQHETVVEEHIAHQQVVHVAAMTRYVDQRVIASDLLDRLDSAEIDAVVQLRPEPGQQNVEETDRGKRQIGGDVLCVSAGFSECRRGRHTLAIRMRGRRAPHVPGCDNPVHQGAAMRKVRTYQRFSRLAKVCAQQAGCATCAHVWPCGGVDDLCKVQGRSKAHEQMRAIEQHAEKPAQAARGVPALGQKQAPEGALPIRCTAPEHRYRDERDVAAVDCGLHAGSESLRVAAGG